MLGWNWLASDWCGILSLTVVKVWWLAGATTTGRYRTGQGEGGGIRSRHLGKQESGDGI